MARRTTSSPIAADAAASTPAQRHSTRSTGRWYANGSRPTRRRSLRATLRISGSGGSRQRRDSVSPHLCVNSREVTATAHRIEITVSNVDVALREWDLDLRHGERPVHRDRELAEERLRVLDPRPHA